MAQATTATLPALWRDEPARDDLPALRSRFRRRAILTLLAQQRWLLELIMTGGVVFTLFTEGAFPFLVWDKRWRWFMVCCSVLLHIFIGVFMGLVAFSLHFPWSQRLDVHSLDGTELLPPLRPPATMACAFVPPKPNELTPAS